MTSSAARSRVLVALRVEATTAEAFRVFTEEIGQWWRPNGLFQFSEGRNGRLAFEPPGPAGRLVETYEDGSEFVIGHVRSWEPARRLVLSWRQASFTAEQQTELHVRFEPVGSETRVTVEHFGWDTIPATHAARHGFELSVFQLRFAEWWRDLLGRLDRGVRAHGPPGAAADDPPGAAADGAG
jgi:uncharacterized protein YndB with AHSA1/START domain